MQQFEVFSEWEGGRVSSIAHYEDNLYIGSSDGKLYRYQVKEEDSSFSSLLMAKTTIRSSKPILSIQCDPTQKKLFVLIDQMILVHNWNNLEHLSTLSNYKGCTSFAINKNYSHDLCLVLQKKKIVFIDYTSDYDAIREIKSPLNDFIVDIEFMKNSICLAYPKQKCLIINTRTGEMNNQLKRMNIASILNQEFSEYLCFVRLIALRTVLWRVNEDNYTYREEIQWMDKKENMHSVGVCFPYLCGIGQQGVEIYSLYEKAITESVVNQSSDKSTGILSEGSKRLFVARGSSVTVFSCLSIDEQISSLIQQMRVEDALTIFDKTWNGSKKEKEIQYRCYCEQAGFIFLFSARFQEAFEQLFRSELDSREILHYYEDLKSPLLPYKPKTNRGDMRDLIKTHTDDSMEVAVDIRVKCSRRYLLEYLLKVKRQRFGLLEQDQLKAVDYAIMKLYLDDLNKYYSELKELLRGNTSLVWNIICETLQYQPVLASFFLLGRGDVYGALKMLKECSEQPVIDSSQLEVCLVEGISVLQSVDEARVVLDYAPWILDKRGSSGVSIFSNKVRKVPLPIQDVINFLQNYPPQFMQVYLEDLIYEQDNDEGQYHTRLVQCYIDELHPSSTIDTERAKMIKHKLSHLMEDSDCYDLSLAGEYLEQTELYEQRLIIYRKLNKHDKALSLLLYKMKDFEWAERYCVEAYMTLEEDSSVVATSNDSSGRQRRRKLMNKESKREKTKSGPYNSLLILLARLCLYPEQDGVEPQEDLVIKMFTTHAKRINPVEAIDLIPENIALDKVSVLLERMLRSSQHEKRQSMMLYNLAKAQYRKTNASRAKGESRRVTIKEHTRCPVCKDVFDAQSIAVLPDLTIVHFKCMNSKSMHKNPITGTDYSLFPEAIEQQIDSDTILHPPFLF